MRTLFPLLMLASAAALAQNPVAQLNAGMHLIQAEVVSEPGARARGLMHRKSLAQNAGMLFVFDEAAVHCMWMKNTYIPLSVAFIDDRGTIVEHRRHAAARRDFALRRPAGAIRAGNEPRLVRRTGNQGGKPPQRLPGVEIGEPR